MDMAQPWTAEHCKAYPRQAAALLNKLQTPKTLRMLTLKEAESCECAHPDYAANAVISAFFAANADALAGFVLGEEAG